MKQKLLDNYSDELIIFLLGWGCDDRPYLNMKSSKNVLLLWDYNDLNFEFDFSCYKKFYLICYSAGVLIGGIIEDKLPEFEQKIAINGNPLLFDSYFGITASAIKAFKELNLLNFLDFRRNFLVVNDEQFVEFNKNASRRSIESCSNELIQIKNLSVNNKKCIEFDKVIISDSDKIFNPQHQIEYYKGKVKILDNSGHDVFHYFKNFDDILNF